MRKYYKVFLFFDIIFVHGGGTLIAGVLVEITNKNVDKIFDYVVPDNLVPFIKVGIRVSVPFGKMTLEGFVL